MLGRYERSTTRGKLVTAEAFAEDGFFALEPDQLLHVNLQGEVAARFDLSALFTPSVEDNAAAVFSPDARTLVLLFLPWDPDDDGMEPDVRTIFFDNGSLIGHWLSSLMLG